jgi:hypothetical protein
VTASCQALLEPREMRIFVQDQGARKILPQAGLILSG